ncbi:unnamed protein product (macronuclear) [Paramecium tetraurelia]|uniref:RING-type domain-containing protein n=1 Tax=Paramecium tetraurelia TaxID=5888 RepID=A0D817_PARTE|nr:uncharacterized protein GSPATT00014151001 [Paramecium tetraurelia]CAK79184.1 unnamed protein product [Paramecium tetraurelia]|eukprot:XP_001446581.1 hypothetical protein (macronuclear) [Paramecium tetraurelia strain d4-2]
MEQFEQQNENENQEEVSGTVKKRIKKVQAKKKVSNEEPPEDCSICYQEIIDKGIIQTCKHSYCFKCIEVWAKQKQTCPQCRMNFNQIKRVRKYGRGRRQKMYSYRSDDYKIYHLISPNSIFHQFINQLLNMPEEY